MRKNQTRDYDQRVSLPSALMCGLTLAFATSMSIPSPSWAYSTANSPLRIEPLEWGHLVQRVTAKNSELLWLMMYD